MARERAPGCRRGACRRDAGSPAPAILEAGPLSLEQEELFQLDARSQVPRKYPSEISESVVMEAMRSARWLLRGDRLPFFNDALGDLEGASGVDGSARRAWNSSSCSSERVPASRKSRAGQCIAAGGDAAAAWRRLPSHGLQRRPW